MNRLKKVFTIMLTFIMMLSILASTASAATFTDTSGHWAADYIAACAGRGIVDGVGGGKFEPEGKVTIAQFTKMLCSAFYSAEEQDFERENYTAIDNYFGGSLPWYGARSYYFKELGLLNGVDYDIQTANSANRSMTRNNMAQVAANVLAQKGITTSEADLTAAQAAMPDYDTIPEASRQAVKTCYALGIINGIDGGKFDGGSTMTRAQACTVITRMLDVVHKGHTDPTPTTPDGPTVKDIAVTTATNSLGTAYHVADNGNPTGYLANGKPINEANIAELLEKAKTIWPTGMTWADTTIVTSGNNWYANPGTVTRNMLTTNGVWTDANEGCGGFSALISDYLFGKSSNPCHVVTNFSDIHPGDVVVQFGTDKSAKHVMIVTSVLQTGQFAGNGVYIAQGNYGKVIDWPDETDEWESYDSDMLAEKGSYVVFSRWPG